MTDSPNHGAGGTSWAAGGTLRVTAAATIAPETGVANASYAIPQQDGSREVTVVLPDGTMARAIMQPNEVLASASPPLKVVE